MSLTSVIMKYPTMTRIGAVASGGITPARDDRNRERRNSTPTTTDVSPVRPPSDTPAALSMYVVFEDADAAPPAAAASESTMSTRLMPGSRPRASSSPASPAIPTTVPIVSKKSESITDSTTAIPVAMPRTSQTPLSENFPSRWKCGALTHLWGTRAMPVAAPQIALCPHP